jgi:hypothetical protein
MHTMHLQLSVAIQPNLELKTRPKQLLGYLPLVIALPDWSNAELSTDKTGPRFDNNLFENNILERK